MSVERTLDRGGSLAAELEGRGAIPEDEIQHLLLAVADARQWGERRQIGRAHALLIRGLARAERALLESQPWAASLSRRWRAAIDAFCEEYRDSTVSAP